MSRGVQRARVDGNHTEIVTALRKAGISVFSTAAVGKGFPDLACGFNRRTVILEVKDGSLPPSGRRLSADEFRFHTEWRGQVCVVFSPEDAIETVLRECA